MEDVLSITCVKHVKVESTKPISINILFIESYTIIVVGKILTSPLTPLSRKSGTCSPERGMKIAYYSYPGLHPGLPIFRPAGAFIRRHSSLVAFLPHAPCPLSLLQ